MSSDTSRSRASIACRFTHRSRISRRSSPAPTVSWIAPRIVARSLLRACLIAAAVGGLLFSSAAQAVGEARAAEPANFEVTTETCPICSDGSLTTWDFVTANQLSIRGADPVGSYVGYWPAEKFEFIDDWYPQSSRKQTLCGTLDHFNFYDGLGDEADWNNFIVPDPPFQYTVDDVVAKHRPTSEWPRDTSGRIFVESEITPDEHFYENPWFPKSSGISPIEDHKLCTYGAWVGEFVHGYKPEIHPSELYWWRSEQSGYLLAVEDDSNRFDRRDDYDFYFDDPPSFWRPWSAVPRTATFDIAFSLSSLRGAATITIFEEASRESVLADSVDADDGTTHAFEFNGRVLLNVVEQGFADNHLKVEFVRYCRDSNNLIIRGYVRLTTKFGSGDRGREGYHLLRFTEEPQPGVIHPQAPEITPGDLAPVLLTADADPDSIRPGTLNGKPALLADVDIKTQATPRSRAGDLIVTSRTVVGAEELHQRRLRKSARRVRVTVPITRSTSVRLGTASGRVMTLAIPPVAPAPELRALRATTPTPAPDLWPLLANTAGGLGTAEPPGATVRATRMSISGVASYAAVKDGRVAREEDSPFAEALTESLRSGKATLRTFGTRAPVLMRWSFSARDLVRGVAVPVSVNAAKPAAIAVRTTNRRGQIAANIVFPNRGAFEVTARVSLRDRFGRAGTDTTTVSNALISSTSGRESVQALIRVAAALVGASADLARLAELESTPSEEESGGRRVERAQAVRTLALQVMRDRIITLAELRRLVEAARLFGQTP
jgi:hypothetical protein